jgi:beta-lactam-binding protein with PASTA domain
MPDLKGLTLREALTRLGKTGAKVNVSGTGIVVTQEPGAGKAMGKMVSLKLVPRAAS